MQKGYIAIGVMAAFVFISLLPIIPVEETYKELEPYQEYYQDVEMYDRRAKYTVFDAVLSEKLSLSIGVYHVFSVVVQNTDDYGGYFTVKLDLYDINGLFRTKSVRHYIGSGGKETFSAEFDTKVGQDVKGKYTVTAPTVTDQRTVTKTRTAYREITKYRTVNKSLVEIISGR